MQDTLAKTAADTSRALDEALVRTEVDFALQLPIPASTISEDPAISASPARAGEGDRVSGGGGETGKDAPRWRLFRQGQGSLPVQVQMNKEAAHPSVCTHTEPKTLVWTPQERNPNITPAPSTDICGQCRSTDKRGAGGRDRHRASPRTTQTPKYGTASPNAGCGCRQHRIPSCRRHMPRQFPVRTHTSKNQNTLRP